MLKKTTITVMVLLFIIFAINSNARAYSIVDITPSLEESYFVDGVLAPPNQKNIEKSFVLDEGALNYFQYKADVGNEDNGTVDKEEGPYAQNYTTSYELFPNEVPNEILTITWDDNDNFIDADPIYLFVKDGIHGNYLFNLSNLNNVSIDDTSISTTYAWTGKDTLRLSGFWPDQGDAISHVSLWGNNPGAHVPEPATMLLFGTGLIGLAWVGRRQLQRRKDA